MALSARARSVWAKFGYDPESDRWLPLWLHLLDAATVAEHLAGGWLTPTTRDLMERELEESASDLSPTEELRLLASWIAGVHDIGKCTPAFSCQVGKLDDRMKEAGLTHEPVDPLERRKVPHALAGHLILRPWLTDEHGWGHGPANALASVVGAHHGIPPTRAALTNELSGHEHLLGGEAWAAAQRELLAARPGVVLVGSWVDFVSPDGAFLYRLEQPVDPAAVRRRMRVNCAITHPAAMFRREAYDRVGGYPTRFPAAEDFALFSLMLQHGEAANIPQALVRCRTGDGGISDKRRRTQLASRCRILLERFDWHPLAVYGLLRAVGQMATPRSWSTRAHRIRVRLTGGRPQAGPAGPPLRRNPPG